MLTTFATPLGRYRWRRLPFGVSPAPEIFQRKLDKCIHDLPCTTRIVDDLLIWGEGDMVEEATESHERHVEQLLERARARNLRLNADKFNFRKTEVKYAGYILTNTGHKPDPSKVQAIVEMPPPKDVAGVRRFISMTNYFAKYLSKLSQLSEPPRQLTKGDTVWEWTHEQSAAFEQIKTALTSALVLAFFDKSLQSSTVQCDASQAALGAVLMRKVGQSLMEVVHSRIQNRITRRSRRNC